MALWTWEWTQKSVFLFSTIRMIAFGMCIYGW